MKNQKITSQTTYAILLDVWQPKFNFKGFGLIFQQNFKAGFQVSAYFSIVYQLCIFNDS